MNTFSPAFNGIKKLSGVKLDENFAALTDLINTITGGFGVTGLQGLVGSQGETGLAGADGSSGIQGLQGNTGLIGATGIAGSSGIQGQTGAQGITGAPGIIAITNYSSTSTVTGWAATPTKYIYYKTVGKLIFCWFRILGTSDAATCSFTLPYNNNALAGNEAMFSVPYAIDNSILQHDGSYCTVAGNSSTVNIFRDYQQTAWTTSGSKQVWGTCFYETTDAI
jgi:hypothetical protein